MTNLFSDDLLSIKDSKNFRLSITTTTTTIFISCPEKFTIDKYMQREILTIKIEHSHLEIAKANRAKWLGQADSGSGSSIQGLDSLVVSRLLQKP